MATQDATRLVFIPVVLGTARQGRLSEPAANFVFDEVSKRGDIQTELIDIRKIPLAVDDAGEALKDSQFSAMVARAAGLILVVPDYNHSFLGISRTSCPSGSLTREPLENPALSFGMETTPDETKCTCASRNFLAIRSTSSVVTIVCQ